MNPRSCIFSTSHAEKSIVETLMGEINNLKGEIRHINALSLSANAKEIVCSELRQQIEQVKIRIVEFVNKI